MSNFGVTIERVVVVRSHDNADRLAIAELDGISYQFVVGNGQFTPGDYVVYFPLDSVIPNELAATIGLPTKEGKPFRVKSIRLRGQWSEGVLAPLSITGLKMSQVIRGMDLTERLGVVKYEPPADPMFNIFKGQRPDNLIALPVTVHRYDIENLQRYPSVYEALRDQVVVVTEKIEGTHFWARIDRDGETLHVGQRNFEIKAPETSPYHPFWATFYRMNLDDRLREMARFFRGYDITIRGELFGAGVQNNYYGFHEGFLDIKIFEVELDGRPIGAGTFLNVAHDFLLPIVPVLDAFNTLGEIGATVDDIIQYANGLSKLNPVKLREGIVIKPRSELYHPEIGRLFIKIRDKEYLAQ